MSMRVSVGQASRLSSTKVAYRQSMPCRTALQSRPDGSGEPSYRAKSLPHGSLEVQREARGDAVGPEVGVLEADARAVADDVRIERQVGDHLPGIDAAVD